jgi:hypothetical protein
MDQQATQLAFTLQAPPAPVPQPDAQRETVKLLWAKAQRLGYDPQRFKDWVVAGLQAEEYSRDLLYLADEQQLSLLLDRLQIEEDEAPAQFAHATPNDFWLMARQDLGLSHPQALAIKDAWTIDGLVNWAGAMAELWRMNERNGGGE